MLNAVKASRQPVGANVANKFGGLAGETMTGPRFPGDDEYDNDASFDPTLNSNSLEYFMNPSDDEAYGEDRWKTGGGVDTGEAVGLHAGRSRDTDGSVDRVRDPPPELLPLLYHVKMQCSSNNVDLYAVFDSAGGSAYGTIPTTKFCSALVVALSRMPLTEVILADVVKAYGCGAQTPAGSVWTGKSWERKMVFECIAWQDFCEDVEKAVDVADTPTRGARRPGGPPPLGR